MPVNEDMPPWELANQAHSELYMARYKATTQEGQNKLANAEWGAFAREATAENPALAVPIAVGTVVRTAGKAAGIIQGRSEGSVDQMVSGLKGVAEGLVQNIGKMLPWQRAEEAFRNPPSWLGIDKPKQKAPEAPVKPLNTEADMIKAAQFTTAELKAQHAEIRSPESIRELLTEISKTKDPKIKKILEDTLTKLKGK
jgi:hypothetical protein